MKALHSTLRVQNPIYPLQGQLETHQVTGKFFRNGKHGYIECGIHFVAVSLRVPSICISK